MEDSYLCRIAKQLSSIQLHAAQKPGVDKPKEDTVMESAEEAKDVLKPVPAVTEKSAFEDSDMEEDGDGGRDAADVVPSGGLHVDRTFTDEGEFVHNDLFLVPQVQVSLVKLLTRVLA